MSNLKNFQALLIENGYDAAIITDQLNQQYLSGFAFTDGMLVITMKRALLITDFRYYEMAQNEKVIAEPDSAATYAAYKKYRHLFEGKKTVLYITGGNISKELFKEIISER